MHSIEHGHLSPHPRGPCPRHRARKGMLATIVDRVSALVSALVSGLAAALANTMPSAMPLPKTAAILLAIPLAIALPLRAAAQPAPAIAAASDLKFALDEIAAAFHARTGQRVRTSYGSSGNFYRQIAQGAPFELFLSADETFVFKLADQGRTLDRGVLYGIGRLVLFAPHASPLTPDPQFTDLRRALAEGRVRKFAIANPEHAPYGKAAMQVLQHQGLWSAIEPRLVLGENVSQAAQFAATGSAQGGLFALSLALAPSVAAAGRHVLVPESWHEPLRQRMVLTDKATQTARDFYAYLQGPAARAVLQRHGFSMPGTAPG